MIEAPEALHLSRQLNRTVRGKKITEVAAGYTPHKFTFYYGSPETYPALLTGKETGPACARGGMVEMGVEDVILLFSDGANLTYLEPGAKLPSKYQLLVGLEDESLFSHRTNHPGIRQRGFAGYSFPGGDAS